MVGLTKQLKDDLTHVKKVLFRSRSSVNHSYAFFLYLVKQSPGFHARHVDGHRHCSCALTGECNRCWVATKVRNVFLHPLKSYALVLKQVSAHTKFTGPYKFKTSSGGYLFKLDSSHTEGACLATVL